MPKDHKNPKDTIESKIEENVDIVDLEQTITDLTAELQHAKEKEQRALADYQNVLRRTQEDKARFAKIATKDLIADIIQPLNHLSLAADHLNDSGLNMVISQLWEALKQNGLEEINPVDQEFDINCMEAVELKQEGATTVSTVVSKGYILNGEVIQVAKVILG